MEHKMLSIADQIFEKLENDILTGKYPHDETLTETRLCEELGVSRTPIHEALRRLESEHLILSLGKGYQVIGIGPQDIDDIFAIRLRLEGLASRWAAERCSEDGIRTLRETVELQEFYTAKNDAENLKQLDTRFHRCIYSLCGSLSMQDTLEPLHRKLQMYRRVSLASHDRAAHSLEEHQAICEAIASRDGALAESLTLEHVRNAYRAITQKEALQ